MASRSNHSDRDSRTCASVTTASLPPSGVGAGRHGRQGTLDPALAADTTHHLATGAGLDVRLDAPLPEAIAVGGGTALFVCGTCFEPGRRIESVALVVDGDEQPVTAHGMPRLDLMRASGEPAAYRAGFWGIARIAPRPSGSGWAMWKASLVEAPPRTSP